MVEYAALTARSLGLTLGNFARQVSMEQVIGVVAAGLLLWMLWRTFGPR